MASDQSHLDLGCIVGSQLIGDDHIRREALLLQQFTNELCGRSLVSSPLHEQVENFALAVDGAPKPERLAANHNGHLIEMPLRGWPLAPAPKFSGEQRSELQKPAPH